MTIVSDLSLPDSPLSLEEYEQAVERIRARHERTQRLFGAVFFLLFIAACTFLYFDETNQGLLFGLIAIYFLVRSTEASLAMDQLDGQRLAVLALTPKN